MTDPLTDLESQLPPEVVEAVRAANRATSRVERWKRIGILYIAALMSVVTGLVVYEGITAANTLDAVRQTQLESAARGIDIKASSANSEQILQTLTDCLTPGGTCYQRNVANQADVLSTVQRLVVVTQICAQEGSNRSYSSMQACVATLMEAHSHE
jgi:hypothetical protein